jgi:hypothetical protein
MSTPILQSAISGTYPPQYASKIEKMQSSNQGDNVYVTVAAGDTLVAVAFGLKSIQPFDQLHGASPSFGYLQGINDFIPVPTISDNSPTTPDLVTAQLGLAASYALLAYSGITNASGSTSISGGVIGSAPTATITGFNPPAATIDNTDAAVARGAGNAAFNYYSGLTATQSGLANLSTNDGGGGVGVYHAGVFKGGALDIPTSITLDAQGNPNAIFVFVAASTVTLESGASIILANGAQAQNVVWVVGSSFTSVTTSHMVGNILAYTSITLGGGSLNGRALAVGGGNGAVTISAANTVTVPSIGGSVNNWVLAASIVLADGDYSGYSIPPLANTSWPSANWNLDGYYPCLYVWVCNSANAGTYPVNLNSVYQDGVVAPLDLAAGKPIFDGGINFQVFDIGDMTSVAVDGTAVAITAANPAVTAPIVTTQNDDAVIVIGLQKSANGLGLGTDATLDGTAGSPPTAMLGYQRVSNGKLVGSQAHYLIEWGVQTVAGSWTPQFANPLGYETLVAAVALKHS